MIYDLQILIDGKGVTIGNVARKNRPLVGESYEIYESTRRELIGFYDVLKVVHREGIHASRDRTELNSKNLLVIIGNKRERL